MSTKIVIVVGLIILMIVVSIVGVYFYMEEGKKSVVKVDATLSEIEPVPVPVSSSKKTSPAPVSSSNGVVPVPVSSSNETAPVPVSSSNGVVPFEGPGCYGAKEGPCNTCVDVIDAHKAKGWSYKTSNFAQCNVPFQGAGCYGAKEDPCNTCTDVIDAHKVKGWSYKASNFAQCNQATSSITEAAAIPIEDMVISSQKGARVL
jgi:hypothetical protein